MTAAFYSRAQGVLLTFDVGQRETYLSLPGWIRDVKRVSLFEVINFDCIRECLIVSAL